MADPFFPDVVSDSSFQQALAVRPSLFHIKLLPLTQKVPTVHLQDCHSSTSSPGQATPSSPGIRSAS